MSKRTRTIEVTVETERRAEVLTAARRFVGTCDGCGSETAMVTADEAAAIAHVSTRTIYAWVEAGKIHFVETPSGSLLVCVNSLDQAATT